MVGSQVVASLTVPQVMATQFRVEEVDDVEEYAANDGSWCRMLVRTGGGIGPGVARCFHEKSFWNFWARSCKIFIQNF